MSDLIQQIRNNINDTKIIPNQDMGELGIFMKFLSERDINTVLEIGIENGGTLNMWPLICNKNAFVIGVDIDFTIKNRISFMHDRYRNINIEIIVGDSIKEKTIKEVRDIIGNRGVDFLFIDGNHDYNYVKSDYKNYSGLVNKDGIIAFHDINLKENSVDKFWKEIKNEKSIEIISDHNKNGYGIGVIIK